MENQNILIYQNEQGNVKVDVKFEDGELDENMVVRFYRTTTQHGAIEGKTQTKELEKDIKYLKEVAKS